MSAGCYYANAIGQLAETSTDTKQVQADLGVGVFADGSNGLGRFSDTRFGSFGAEFVVTDWGS